MPLTHKRSLVTSGLEVLREIHQIGSNRIVVIDHLVVVGVEARNNRGSTGSTEGRRDKGIGEVCPVGCHPIHLGCLEPRMPNETHGIISVIIREHEDDVSRFLSGDFLNTWRGRLKRGNAGKEDSE